MKNSNVNKKLAILSGLGVASLASLAYAFYHLKK